MLVGEHVTNLLACFKAAFGLWDRCRRSTWTRST